MVVVRLWGDCMTAAWTTAWVVEAQGWDSVGVIRAPLGEIGGVWVL